MNIPVTLTPGQRSAMEAKGRELMVAAEPRSGASHLLRTMALLRAGSSETPLTVVLAAPDDRSLREQHMDGEGGVWKMIDALPAGWATWLSGNALLLKNKSIIRFGTWESAARRSADLILVDDADALGLADFQRLRERALQNPGKGEEGQPRLVVVSHRPGEGWVKEHFSRLNGHGARADLASSEIPERLRGSIATSRRECFGDWIARVLPSMRWYWHVELMVETAQRVVDGEITRLLVSAPPRYFKSLVWARLLPAYYLTDRPDEFVALVSSGADLAEALSGDAREFYRAGGAPFRSDSMDKSLWRTIRGGGMWARGVQGRTLGWGYGLGIIDDPFASWPEAMKPSVQENVEEYFWKTFYGRRNIDGARPAAIVVNHQALAEGDLRGRILKRELDAKLPSEGWTVLNLPAIKRARRDPWPPSVTVIPDPREEGEPLCPELQDQDLEGLLRLEEVDRNLFAATHQQEPLPDQGGGMFERWWWSFACPREKVEALAPAYPDLTPLLLALMDTGALPILHREGRAWDIAASLQGEGDASASVRGGIALRRSLQEVIFTHAEEYYYPAHAVLDLIYETACQDGTGVEVILPAEPAGAGKIMIANLRTRLEDGGFRVVVVPTSGSKRVRANPHAGAAAPIRNAKGEEDGRMGRCYILPGDWNALFCERHHRFDGVTKPLDLVDAASYLFSELDGSSFLTSGIR